MKPRSTWIPLGRLGRPKGLKGEIFLDAEVYADSILPKLRSVYLSKGSDPKKFCLVDDLRKEPKRWVIHFDGVSSRDEASRLTGEKAFVRRENCPDLPDGTYYPFDLEGLEVITHFQKKVGILESVMKTASKDVYVIRTPSGEELLLPAIESVLQRVDLEKSQIHVELPEVVHAF